MLDSLEATPCPAHINLQASAIHTSPFVDVAKDLDYTTDLQAALRNAPPIRTNFERGASVLSHQIATLESERKGFPAKAASHGSRYKIQRPRSPMGTVDRGKSLVRDRNRHPANLKGKQGNFTIYEGDHEDSAVNTAPLRKVPRRRTIYVPSEDTTILTIHPGGLHHVSKPVAPTIVAVESMDSRKGRQSDCKSSTMHNGLRNSLIAASKRAPLQLNLKTIQACRLSHDRPGSGPGKENLIPLTATTHDSLKISKIQNSEHKPDYTGVEVGHGVPRVAVSPISGDPLKGAKKSVPSKPYVEDPNHAKALRKSATIPYCTVVDGPTKRRMKNVTLNCSSKDNTRRAERSSMAMPLVPRRKHNSRSTYPLLQEDLYRPEMYEEAWMSDQESALAQLINALFEATDAGEEPAQDTEHRKRRQVLLRLYQEPPTVLLFERLQASILCGSLSVPKGSSKEVSRLKHDVGFRRKFIDVWIKTFDPFKLRAAAETVIGREVLPNSSPLAKQPTNQQPTAVVLKENLENFIDKCLLHNEDSLTRKSEGPSGSNFGSSLWSQRKTILRSLMMIFLLDKAKELRLVKGNLFLRTSNLKSTEAVLKEISRLLLPSVGDIMRPLGRLGFCASHVQYPLCEYEYRFDNLATAFRDGMRLTHLVELLLYPPGKLTRQDKDHTVTMPTGEMLSMSISDHQSWVLSKHLIFPCIGRSQKIYNVQVALSALRGVQGSEQITDKVTAEDFVDGHREKTMVMLWGLVGKWGLGTLVDCTDLRNEVHRLEKLLDGRDNRDRATNQDYESDVEELQEHTQLLKMWARNVAQLRGLIVANLTTSFANGRVFAAIVDEYESYLPHRHKITQGRVKETGDLPSRLRRIGCNTCFGKNALLSSFYVSHTK